MNIGVDRISALPESIIHDQIMPRLSRRDRARISASSKTWYHLNKTYPALDFDFDFDLQKENSVSRFGPYSPELCTSFKSFINRADISLHQFSQRNLCLHSLRVKFSQYPYSKSYNSDLNRWVESALENRVEKLKLYCPDSPNNKPEYSLPEPVYFSATLTTLKLVKCVLDLPLSTFTSLKKLTLLHCSLNSGSIVLNHYDCPALKSLTLKKCDGFDSLYISNLDRLRRVVLGLHSSLNVEIASQIVQEISITGSISLEPQHKINIDVCNGLKSLYFKYYAVTDQDIEFFLSNFPLLEELYVFGEHELKAVKVSSPRLKTLVIAAGYGCGLKSIDIDVPNLKNFMFISNMTEHTEIKVQQAGGLETLVLHSKVMTDEKFHELIANFPLLQSLWMIGCYKFQTIEIPNVQLKRVYIARCFKLKCIKVGSHELFEMYCSGCDGLEIVVMVVIARSLRRKRFVNWSNCLWSPSFQRMLRPLVRENFTVKDICNACFFY